MLTDIQIKSIGDVLGKNGKIKNAWVFGSFARNQESPDSDVDILFNFKKGMSFGVLEMSGVVSALEKLLGRDVDFIKEDALLPFAKEMAEQEKILIYGNQ